MNRKNDSFGCFVSQTAVRTASQQDDLKRLYFQTTAGDDYRGRRLDSQGQVENLEGLYYMGQKGNKYMSYPLKRVPNFSREHCNYTFDYRKKPFSDNELNSHTCDQLREYGATGSITQADLPATKTLYASDFGERDPEVMKTAKGKSQEPPHRYCDSGRLLITKSFSQTMHGMPSPEINCKGGSLRPNSSLVNPKSHWKDAMRTIYGGDYKKRSGLEGRRTLKTFSASEPTLRKL